MSKQTQHETGAQATLISTGEKVRVLYRVQDGQSGTTRYCCVLPPQAPGHRRRIETIGAHRLS